MKTLSLTAATNQNVAGPAAASRCHSKRVHKIALLMLPLTVLAEDQTPSLTFLEFLGMSSELQEIGIDADDGEPQAIDEESDSQQKDTHNDNDPDNDSENSQENGTSLNIPLNNNFRFNKQAITIFAMNATTDSSHQLTEPELL